MSPVEFKKTLCRPVDFKGQGPPYSSETYQNRPGNFLVVCLA